MYEQLLPDHSKGEHCNSVIVDVRFAEIWNKRHLHVSFQYFYLNIFTKIKPVYKNKDNSFVDLFRFLIASFLPAACRNLELLVIYVQF